MSKVIVSNEFVSYFSLEISLLLHAGIGVEDGLHLLSEDESNPGRKDLLSGLSDQVSNGRILSQAMRETGSFPEYVCDMIETGEKSGRIEQSFQSLSDYYDGRVQLASQIRNALLYPVILLCLMLVIILILLVKVLPIFDRVYGQLGSHMKGSAAVLLRFGQALGNSLPIWSLVIGIFVLVVVLVMAVPSLRRYGLSVHKHFFGDRGIARKVGTARFASAMAMGLMSGLNTEEAFQTAALFHDEVPKAKKRYQTCLAKLDAGEPLARAMKESNILDATYCRILELGIKSGTGDTAMAEIARRLNQEAENSIHEKVGRIEPTIVIVTSILVGMILLSVMLPLMNIMSSIG